MRTGFLAVGFLAAICGTASGQTPGADAHTDVCTVILPPGTSPSSSPAIEDRVVAMVQKCSQGQMLNASGLPISPTNPFGASYWSKLLCARDVVGKGPGYPMAVDEHDRTVSLTCEVNPAIAGK